MTDPGFIAAAYGIVLAGVSLYALSVARRTQGARRVADVLHAEREGRPSGAAGDAGPTSAREPSEASR